MPGCAVWCRSAPASDSRSWARGVVDREDEIVCIPGYDGPDGFDHTDGRYYASPDRASLDPDPPQWFESSESVRKRRVL